MTTLERLLTILAVALGTQLTRWLPFLAFPAGRRMPDVVRYLGRGLPAAVFGLLVVYCLRNVTLLSGSHGLPEAIALLAVAGLHLWKRPMLLSIAGGTLIYMLLVF